MFRNLNCEGQFSTKCQSCADDYTDGSSSTDGRNPLEMMMTSSASYEDMAASGDPTYVSVDTYLGSDVDSSTSSDPLVQPCKIESILNVTEECNMAKVSQPDLTNSHASVQVVGTMHLSNAAHPPALEEEHVSVKAFKDCF